MTTDELFAFCRAQAEGKTAGFFVDMVRRGTLGWTPNMRAAIERAAKRAAVTAVEEVALTDAAGFQAISAMFKRAAGKLSQPFVLLDAPEVGTIRLSLAGPRARFPGSINVADKARFGEGAWYGRIHADGRFETNGRLEGGVPQGVVSALVAFAADPVRAAREWGRVHGRCCFCSQPLKAGQSVWAGFGPICAEKFGLDQTETAEYNRSRDAVPEAA